MKKLWTKRSNLYLLAAVVIAAAVGIWCLMPGDGTAGTTVLGGGQVPLSAGGEAAQAGAVDVDLSVKPATDAGDAAAVSDPYAAVNPYQAGNPGNTDSTGSTGSTGNPGGTGVSAAPTATLSISCYTILNNIGNLTPGKEGLVPPDGTIMGARAVTFTEGETVFDVLAREVRSSGIHMEFVNTPLYNSAYIEGINNLYEFDCGPLSGWMYRVNGWYPNYGCSQYVLSDGDVIEWIYTCDLGNDIGGGGATQG
jgi:hypothetical protein